MFILPKHSDCQESFSLEWANWLVVLALVLATNTIAGEGPEAIEGSTPPAIIEFARNRVEVLRAGSTVWDAASTNASYNQLRPGDQLRTGDNSRAGLRLPAHRSTLILDSNSRLMIPAEPEKSAVFRVLKGRLFNFHRGQQEEQRFLTPTVSAIVRGTDFTVEVDEAGTTIINMLNGEVSLETEHGSLALHSGERAVAPPGEAPYRTSFITAMEVIQWCLHYPAVLDIQDLPFTADDEVKLKGSLAAYIAGDLPGALQALPSNWETGSNGERLYGAAVLLSLGNVSGAKEALESLSLESAEDRDGRRMEQLVAALRSMIAAVSLQSPPYADSRDTEGLLPTEYLVESYRAQATGNLDQALTLARQAVVMSPDFGFGWARVAELEFGFGRIDRTRQALSQALAIAPMNAAAVALKGFEFAARNRIHDAQEQFSRAIALNPTLSDGWLGRGLCSFRVGQRERGLDDLQMAATVEPQRALLRSYLGKGFSDNRNPEQASEELDLAMELDPNDPTAWLYSALEKQRQNRINEAIRDLEKSKDLNDNRALFRSQLLLDQDAAVRGANLASIYRDVGMQEVSVREATRAVEYDYANYSAHLFLANSYNQLRDPRQINLRYETPWLSEYLLANLLSPVGAGTLSQIVSAQDYSKLFEQDGFGVASRTDYFSGGDWVQAGSQYGHSGSIGYALDSYYRSENGDRPNQDQEQLTLSAQLKLELTPSDRFFLQALYYDASGGDLKQYYDQSSAHLDLRTKETQEPLLMLGYDHEWSPGVHTLALAGRFDDTFNVTDSEQPVLLLARDGAGEITAVPTPGLPTSSLAYESELEMYSAELQQIWQTERHSVIVGSRFQSGLFDTDTDLGASTPTMVASTAATSSVSFATSPISQSVRSEFEHLTGYGYYYWRVLESLQLVGGLSYDHLRYPVNHRNPPIAANEETKDQFSPKAGFTWTPTPDAAVRFAYTRSLGGVSFDQSVRLEPTQVAGFNQAFRSLIPESVVGSIAGAELETFGLLFEKNFDSGTYFSVAGELLNSEASRVIGTVDLSFPPSYSPSGTRQDLDFQERNLVVTANQLLGDEWSLGARYRLSQVELDSDFPEIPATVTTSYQMENEATLHQLAMFGLYNHPSGFFARGEALWNMQNNHGYQPAMSGDEFWHFNLLAGWRFFRRQMQVQVGILNLSDQDYQLNPLNLHTQLPRERTFVASFQFNF